LLGGRYGDPERCRSLVVSHAHEVTQLDQFGLARIHGRELFQRVTQSDQHVVIGNRRRDFDFIDIQRLDAPATQNGNQTPSGPSPGRLTEKKRRGRPPKNKQD